MTVQGTPTLANAPKAEHPAPHHRVPALDERRNKTAAVVARLLRARERAVGQNRTAESNPRAVDRALSSSQADISSERLPRVPSPRVAMIMRMGVLRTANRADNTHRRALLRNWYCFSKRRRIDGDRHP